MSTFLSATNLADLTGTSLATAQKWGESGVYPYHKNEKGKEGFYMEELTDVGRRVSCSATPCLYIR